MDEVVERLDDRTADELTTLREYEEQHKGRVTLLEVIDEQLEPADPDGDADDADSDGGRTTDRAEATPPARSVSEPVDEDDTGVAESSTGAEPADDERRDDGRRAETEPEPAMTTNGPDFGDEVTVRYHGAGRGYVGGEWFDGGREERTITYSSRVESAIDDGTLVLTD
ncbi:hypothetical protein HUG10_21525 (plasmid) [Halorarum halophilum]|uniref:Uncharacterized protein n=1 Tax=Halorarum halophilum TaxID=2743090 RepID=A0A7D5GKY4_9EURY|nr:hypothetical protein [Halobaculum halophilum]QLG30171.1 hypothetical protein HUG10_21525 [Halobaculum halophilum]